MKSKIFKKISLCFASALIAFSVGAVAGCSPETDHPEVRITYEFNGETYAVDYKLYRNMYPHTVRHFIELSDEGFYNNMIIHNYQTNDWFTGAYSYNASEYSSKIGNENQMTEYLEEFSKESAYYDLAASRLSASVYTKFYYDSKGNEYVEKADALPTLIGEFYNNINQDIEKGALTADYGCLKMFYYEKQSTQKIYVAPTNDQIIIADYKRNCATSVFTLQTGVSSAYTETNYAVFAQLKETETFDELVAAVKAYIDDNYATDTSGFYSKTTARVDNLDEYTNKAENDKGTEVTFNVPRQPIIVKSVKVTKY